MPEKSAHSDKPPRFPALRERPDGTLVISPLARFDENEPLAGSPVLSPSPDADSGRPLAGEGLDPLRQLRPLLLFISAALVGLLGLLVVAA